MKMPPYDWTRNEDAARKMVEDKLNEKETIKKPWEKWIISILWKLCLGALIVYAVWDLFVK